MKINITLLTALIVSVPLCVFAQSSPDRFVWPLGDGSEIVASYNGTDIYYDSNPFSGTNHLGSDYNRIDGNDCGEPVLAASQGIVVDVDDQDTTNWGNYVRIRHNTNSGTYYTLYTHLSRVDVSINQNVLIGQQIGLMGTTGNSTGCHLHFGVRSVNSNGCGYYGTPASCVGIDTSTYYNPHSFIQARYTSSLASTPTATPEPTQTTFCQGNVTQVSGTNDWTCNQVGLTGQNAQYQGGQSIPANTRAFKVGDTVRPLGYFSGVQDKGHGLCLVAAAQQGPDAFDMHLFDQASDYDHFAGPYETTDANGNTVRLLWNGGTAYTWPALAAPLQMRSSNPAAQSATTYFEQLTMKVCIDFMDSATDTSCMSIQECRSLTNTSRYLEETVLVYPSGANLDLPMTQTLTFNLSAAGYYAYGGNQCPPSGYMPGDVGWCTSACTCDAEQGNCTADDQCTSPLVCDFSAVTAPGEGLCRASNGTGSMSYQHVNLCSTEPWLMSDGTYGCSPRPEPVPATQTFWIRGRLPGLSTSVTPQIRIEVHSAQQLITVRIVSVHEMQVQDDVWEFYANGNTLSHYGDGFYEVFVDVGGGWQYLDTHNIDGEEAPPVNPNPVNYDYCTDQGYQCASAEGDCDGNEDCQTGLQCIHDVGDWFGMAWDVDVCGQSEQVLSSVSTHRDCDDQYDWSFSDWSVCSARTGGTRTRSATLVQQNCLNPGSLPRVDVQNCDDFYSEDSQGWRIEAEGAYALQQNADQYPRIAPDCVDVDGTTLYSGLMFSGDHPGTNAQIIVPASPGTYDLWIAYRSHHSHWDNFAPEFYVEMNGQQFTVPSTRNYVPNGVEERFLGQMVVTSTTTNVTIRIGGEELMHYSSRWIEVDYLRGVLVQTTSPDAGVSDAGETDVGVTDSGVSTITYEIEDWQHTGYHITSYPQSGTRTAADGTVYAVKMLSGGDMHSVAYQDVSYNSGQRYEVCANYLNFGDSPDFYLEFGTTRVATFPAGSVRAHGNDPQEYCFGEVTMPSTGSTMRMHVRVGTSVGVTGQANRWIGLDWLELRPQP